MMKQLPGAHLSTYSEYIHLVLICEWPPNKETSRVWNGIFWWNLAEM